jgi:hypothetical protein
MYINYYLNILELNDSVFSLTKVKGMQWMHVWVWALYVPRNFRANLAGEADTTVEAGFRLSNESRMRVGLHARLEAILPHVMQL